MQTCDFRYCHFQLAVAQAAANNGITNSKSTVTRKLSPCLAAQDILAFTVATEGDPFVVGVVDQQTAARTPRLPCLSIEKFILHVTIRELDLFVVLLA